MTKKSGASVEDRLGIEDVLTLYCQAIDTRDFALLEQVFTADGVGDYRASGGVRGSVAEVQAWLATALAPFTVVQHLVTNVRVRVDGDEATSTCYLFNPLGFPGEDGAVCMLYCGATYRDRLVRTADGWRIRERVIEPLYLDGPLPGS